MKLRFLRSSYFYGSDLYGVGVNLQQPEGLLQVVPGDPVDRQVVPAEALYHHHVAYDPCNRIRPMLGRFKFGYQIDDGHLRTIIPANIF